MCLELLVKLAESGLYRNESHQSWPPCADIYDVLITDITNVNYWCKCITDAILLMLMITDVDVLLICVMFITDITNVNVWLIFMMYVHYWYY